MGCVCSSDAVRASESSPTAALWQRPKAVHGLAGVLERVVALEFCLQLLVGLREVADHAEHRVQFRVKVDLQPRDLPMCFFFSAVNPSVFTTFEATNALAFSSAQ